MSSFTLSQLAQQQPELALDQFVAVANQLLPEFLPAPIAGNRGQEPVNPRLVRHYTTQGLLDKPLKQGREVRYLYRHVLQLLIVRRLLAEGYSVTAIASLLGGQTNAELEQLLQGGVQLTVEAANPALAFLTQLRDRGASSAHVVPQPSALSRSAVPPSPAARSASPPAPGEVWTRLELLDGVELHIRQDAVLPATPHERDRLLQLIRDRLTTWKSTQSRQSPPAG